ncbi:MAG: CHAT domain-containing protein, partial [Armatimonadota bacterium]
AGSVLVEFARVPIFDFVARAAQGDPEWAPDRYLAFVMAAGEPDGVQMVDLGEVDPIDQQITAYRAAITGEDPDGDTSQRGEEDASGADTHTSDRRAGILRASEHLASDPPEPSATTGLDRGRVLRALVFDPLRAAIGGHTRLFVAPDGNLARLPFEVLPLEDDRFLIDAYHISYLGAGRDILRYGTASDRQAAPAMIVADPDYDLTSETKPHPASGVPFRRLIGARLEAATVASLLNVEPLVDTEAVETTLKLCRSPRILHVATHGFFLPDSPDLPVSEPTMTMLGSVGGSALGRLSGHRLENPLLRSGLALAGANSWLSGEALPLPAEDGLLTGEDVTGMDLLDTELVVLSACETGLGDVHIGEGIIGLRRAFVTAGARTLIMSLWKVPDYQTQDLMREFYESLLAGRPRADALRDAQLAMKSLYPNPHYWGAFICQGHPGPLS